MAISVSTDSDVVSMDGKSFWLDPRLCNEVPGDLAALSAISFLKASSSRSNLDRILINNYSSQSPEGNSLSTKDLDVKTSSIPYANREDQKKEDRTPERAAVKKERSRYFRQNCINYPEK